jgi:hypothetical protein
MWRTPVPCLPLHDGQLFYTDEVAGDAAAVQEDPERFAAEVHRWFAGLPADV